MRKRRFRGLYELGFNLIALVGKVAIESWTQYQVRRATEAEIDRWERDPRNLNVGVVTGRTSNNLVVLDIDGPKARKRIEEQFGPLPHTPTVRTAKGWHLYLIDHTGKLRNFVGRIEGVDLRANGGYVVGPGSVHPNGHVYAWEPGLSPSDVPFADVPDWLYGLARRKPFIGTDEPHFTPPWSGGWRPPRVAAYATRALDAGCFEVESAPPKTRNDRLNAVAFSLGRLVASGALSRSEVEAGLHHACHVNGLVEDDGERSVQATIRSGIEAGMMHPRDLRFLTRPSALSRRGASR